MSICVRPANQIRRSRIWAGHSGLMHRRAVSRSLSSRSTSSGPEHLGHSVTAFRAVGATEVVAVAALWWGHILGPEVLGVAAAVGLVVLMAGAVASHLRAGDTPRATAPAVVVAVLLLALLALGVSP